MHPRYDILLSALLLTAASANSQPYIDLVNVRYMKSPDLYVVSPSSSKTVLTYFNVSTTLPLVLKSKDAIIFSPYFETWKVELSRESKSYYGLVLPVSYLKNINDKWSLLTTGIIRWNDSAVYKNMRTQVGGAMILSRKFQDNLTLKAGLYVNKEFFGLFVMPLFGIDWQMSTRDCMFGVLPGSLTYQHERSRNVKYGITFRAQTNSYHRQLRSFTRVDENELGAYIDFYLAKKLVLNLEGGTSILRKVRTGKNIYSNDKYTPYDVNDNLYFKMAFAYRLPLR